MQDSKGSMTFWVTWCGFVLGSTALLLFTFMLVLTGLSTQEQPVTDVGYLTDMLGPPQLADDTQVDWTLDDQLPPYEVILNWGDEPPVRNDWWDVALEESLQSPK